jgi:putative ABC transport system permease protein
MPLADAIRMAFDSLRTQKLKSFFSLIGVLIGVTFLIAVVSIVQGMNVYMEQKFTTAFIGVNTFQIRRRPAESFTETAEQRREWNRRPPVRDAETDYIRTSLSIPARFARQCTSSLTMTWHGRVARGIDVTGTEDSYFEIKKYAIDRGRAFTAPEVRAGAPVVVLGGLVAEKLFRGSDPIGLEVAIGGIPFRVVGTVAAQGTMFGMPLDKFAVVPYGGPIQRFLCEGHNVDLFSVQTVNNADLSSAVGEVQGILRRHRRLRPDQPENFTIETSDGALDTWNKISTVLIVALPGLVAISLVVGGIVIMNIMLMAVSERTREIGVRKALGAKRRDILAQFLVESITLSSVGAVLGIASGIGLAFLIRAVTPLPAAVAPWSVALGVAIGLGVGIVAGMYPASRASLLDPIQALRAE